MDPTSNNSYIYNPGRSLSTPSTSRSVNSSSKPDANKIKSIVANTHTLDRPHMSGILLKRAFTKISPEQIKELENERLSALESEKQNPLYENHLSREGNENYNQLNEAEAKNILLILRDPKKFSQEEKTIAHKGANFSINQREQKLMIGAFFAREMRNNISDKSVLNQFLMKNLTPNSVKDFKDIVKDMHSLINAVKQNATRLEKVFLLDSFFIKNTTVTKIFFPEYQGDSSRLSQDNLETVLDLLESGIHLEPDSVPSAVPEKKEGISQAASAQNVAHSVLTSSKLSSRRPLPPPPSRTPVHLSTTAPKSSAPTSRPLPTPKPKVSHPTPTVSNTPNIASPSSSQIESSKDKNNKGFNYEKETQIKYQKKGEVFGWELSSALGVRNYPGAMKKVEDLKLGEFIDELLSGKTELNSNDFKKIHDKIAVLPEDIADRLYQAISNAKISLQIRDANIQDTDKVFLMLEGKSTVLDVFYPDYDLTKSKAPAPTTKEEFNGLLQFIMNIDQIKVSE